MTRTLLLAAASLLASTTAHAINCADLPPPVVYGTGGSASRPTIGRIATALAARTDGDRISIVYKSVNGCQGIYSLLQDQKLTGTANYWDGIDGLDKTCDLPAGGQDPEFANLAHSTKLCSLAPDPLPAGIGDFVGAINTINLFVPLASSQTAISAAAAYFVFGFGAAGQAAPWTTDSEITIRDPNAAVQQLLGAAIRVPSSKFVYGVDSGGNSQSITRVAASTNPEAAIGYSSGQNVDARRDVVRTLAYQHYGQSCGYLPDSSSTSFDKRNVREGRYYIWSSQHWWAKVDTVSGAVTSPTTAKLIGWLTGTLALPTGFELLRYQILAGEIPHCAMKVGREGDIGDVFLRAPTKACHGYFESLTGGTTATACPNGPSDCAGSAPACNYGYCEVQ